MKNNKKGMIGQIIIVAITILIIFIFANVVIPYEDDGRLECQSQCQIKNMSFHTWSGGGYRNYNCNCQNETTMEITTIYTK